jgi:hypothetical protein
VRSLDLLRDHYGCDILVVHHANREHEKEGGKLSIRGSSVLYGAADVCWHLTRCGTVAPEDQADRVLELRADKLRERPNENVVIQTRMVSVEMHEPQPFDSEGRPQVVVNEYGAVQTTLVVKPTRSSLVAANRVRALIEHKLDWEQDEVTYADVQAGVPDFSQSKLEDALSLILTYPGQWGGITTSRPGVFVREGK